MKIASSIFAFLFLPLSLAAQTVNTQQQVTLAGLRTVAGHGGFVAAKYEVDGSLVLLVNQGDGIRLLKTNGGATTVLAQAFQGATGDVAVAMSLDPVGNVYVTGTTTSGALSGTSGTVYAARADTSTNSFVAKFDANLNLLWLGFLGSGRTAAAAIAATADAVFVTGITYNSAFPVTASGVQQTPASGSSGNGFVERFSADGTRLVYATYLTGVGGDTTPSAVVADVSDDAYVVGATTATGFPTISALQPTTQATGLGSPSGFLTKIAPSGSSFVFSTFLAGTGLTGLALDSGTNTLLLTGNVAMGQFPVATVAAPLVATAYQALLRIPVDGQSVTSSVLLVPGTQSFATPDGSGGVWVSGALSTPLFPATPPPDAAMGDSFLLHLTSTNVFDQTLRFGGLVASSPQYASLASNVAAPAVSASEKTATLPGTLTASVASSLLATQRFDLGLVQAPNNVLPNGVHDMLPTAAACGTLAQCVGTAGLLVQVSTIAGAALGVSSDNLPNVLIRNAGSLTATGLVFAVSGYTQANDCGTMLAASSQCTLALTGSGPGSLTVSAGNAPGATVALGANTVVANGIALSTSEMDFGVQTSTSAAATRSLTLTNLTATPQSFTVARDGGAAAAYTFVELGTTCAGGVVPANASCTVTFSLTVSANAANDGPVAQSWKIAGRELLLTGFAEAASLSLSAAEIDFGTQFSNTSGLDLPRYLYVSNNSGMAVSHAAVTLAAGSAFAAQDGCPGTLEPHTVCQIKVTYLSSAAPSEDAATLALDGGLSVLLTGTTLPPAGVTGSAANPSLSVSPSSISFATAVPVTGVSSVVQTVTVKNTGAVSFPLTLAVAGDFVLTNGCPTTLTAGASCTLQVGFAPSQPGVRDGLLSLTTGSSFAPTYVALTGTGSAILPANNGTLALGQTLIGEPVVAWYKVQQSLVSLTATVSAGVSAGAFGVALVADTGSGHGALSPASFSQSATAACGNCWLGVEFLSQTAGAQSAALALTTVAGGNAYALTVTATALPVTGLLLTPVTQDFGVVAVHSASAVQVFTLANLLGSAATAVVQSVAVTGDFAVVANGLGGAACSGALVATASCFAGVVFAPTAVGARSGTLTVVTSAGTVTATLTGYALADPGVALSPTSLTFKSAPGIAAVQQSVVVTNTGAAAVVVGAVSASDASFTIASGCGTLAAAASCTVVVTFVAQTAPVSAVLSVPVTATVNGQVVATVYSVALSGTYTTEDAGLEVLPNVVNFGAQAAGTLGLTREFTLTNLTAKTLTVSLAVARSFPLAAANPCATLGANASCTFSVSFVPETAGALTGTVFATGAPTDGTAAVQALGYMLGYGAGVSKLAISSGAELGFGQVTSGQVATQTVTLMNAGTTVLHVRRVSSGPPFLATTNCAGAIAAGASCAVTLQYAPINEVLAGASMTARSDAGSLVVESDAVSGPDMVALSGLAAAVVSSAPASSAVLSAFSLSESALTFANTAVGSASTAQSVTLTNTGTTAVHVSGVIAGVDYTTTNGCGVQLPGTSCVITVAFTPVAQGATSERAETLEIASDAATALEFVSLLGTSAVAPLTISPTALDFGTVNVGATGVLAVTVTNTGATPVTFVSLTSGGSFGVAMGSCPAAGSTLAAGATCAVQVSFLPAVAGPSTGTLSLATDATPLPLTVALTGIAVAAHLTATPGALSFGAVTVGVPAPLGLTLLNSGSASVNGVTATVSGANAADFAVTTPCSTTSLAVNQGCGVVVTFTASAIGARVATLTVASSDPSGPLVIPLTGIGIAAGGIALSVATPTMTVKSGSPAVYALTLTPLNGFTGAVALTCTPLTAGPYATTCSLLASSLTLGAAQSSTATINTITSSSREPSNAEPSNRGMMAWVLFAPALLLLRRSRRGAMLATYLVLSIGVWLSLLGCGGSSPTAGNANLHYTPAGTYQYAVTASSTTGVAVSSTVTLTLVVQ